MIGARRGNFTIFFFFEMMLILRHSLSAIVTTAVSTMVTYVHITVVSSLISLIEFRSVPLRTRHSILSLYRGGGARDLGLETLPSPIHPLIPTHFRFRTQYPVRNTNNNIVRRSPPCSDRQSKRGRNNISSPWTRESVVGNTRVRQFLRRRSVYVSLYSVPSNRNFISYWLAVGRRTILYNN